jgi:predicted acyl esterase
VSVLYTTTGRGTGKAYVPRQLVVTLTTAGPVNTHPGLTYEVEATTDTCGDVTFTFEPGTAYGEVFGRNGWAEWGTCTSPATDSSVELLTVKVDGDEVVWSFGLRSTPLEVGTELTDFRHGSTRRTPPCRSRRA